MLLAGGEEDTIALFIVTLAEGDMRQESNDDQGCSRQRLHWLFGGVQKVQVLRAAR